MGEKFSGGVHDVDSLARRDALRALLEFVGVDPRVACPNPTVGSALESPNLRGLSHGFAYHEIEMQRPLNWREIAKLAEWIHPEITGMFVDRIIVPERREFPEGYLKSEWAIRVTSRGREAVFVFSVRPGKPGLDWIPGKGPRASTHASRSGFDLSLNKLLSGRKVIGLEAIPRERSLVLWIENGSAEHPKGAYGLVLTLIPALPEALLIEAPTSRIEGGPFSIVVRSRVSASDSAGGGEYLAPDGARSPADLVVREAGFASLEAYRKQSQENLDLEAFELRMGRARTRIAQELKQAKTRLAQNRRTETEARNERDYRHLGDLLKSAMGMNPPLSAKNTRTVTDWESGAETEIPCDPKLSLKEQVEKFYSAAKRKERRISEAGLRAATFLEKIEKLDRMQAELDRIAISALRGKAKLGELEPFEKNLGLSVGAPEGAEAKALRGAAGGKGSKAGWSGKTFVSKEGLPILVGRSKDENLELTFRFARGNDLWMHVKGKPGAHVVIPLRSKKNASLETLLDAAYLCLHYSGGAEWGKTEVDYTQKKHVKRIRDSSEASYVQNKTLIVEVDRMRLQALLGQEIV